MNQIAEKETKDFLDLLPEIIFEVDKDLNVNFLNNSCERILGYNKNDFINKPLPLEKIVVAEDLLKLRQNLNSIFKGKKTKGNTYRIYDAKKQVKVLEIYNSILLEKGEIVGLRSIAIDITEKEKKHQQLTTQEKHYRLIYQNSPIPYQSLNEKGEFLDINPAWEKLLFYKQSEIIGKSFVDLIANEDKELFETNFLKLKRNGEINNLELRLKNKKNEIIYTNFNCKIEYSENNKFFRSHCVFNNVTLQKLAEQTLLKSERRLQELNATKDKFFSIIAHDLKNPFNDLMGFSQLLDMNIEKYDNKKIKQFVNIIHQSSKLAYNLLENLLDWSRSQTGAIKFNPENISLNLIIEETVDLLESTAKNKNLNIYSDLTDDLYAYADQNMIRTVIRNLISNAIKYTKQGGYIKIVTSKNNLECKVSIVDTGIGISEKNLDKIFKIDESYSTLGTEREKGTGLGLILCKEFIDRNNGEINVLSELDKGSTFSFSIPSEKIL